LLGLRVENAVTEFGNNDFRAVPVSQFPRSQVAQATRFFVTFNTLGSTRCAATTWNKVAGLRLPRKIPQDAKEECVVSFPLQVVGLNVLDDLVLHLLDQFL
jgi:hypothetical protein